MGPFCRCDDILHNRQQSGSNKPWKEKNASEEEDDGNTIPPSPKKRKLSHFEEHYWFSEEETEIDSEPHSAEEYTYTLSPEHFQYLCPLELPYEGCNSYIGLQTFLLGFVLNVFDWSLIDIEERESEKIMHGSLESQVKVHSTFAENWTKIVLQIPQVIVTF